MKKEVQNKSYKWIIIFAILVVVCATGSYIKSRSDSIIVIEGYEPVAESDVIESDIPDTIDDLTVNVNTATVEELCKVPGITPRIARNIVEFREALGGISNIDDIRYVPGIGKTMYEEIGAYLTIE